MTIPDDAYNHNLTAMRKAMVEKAATYPVVEGYAYTSAFDFLLQHGRDYKPGAAWQHYPRGVQKECYGNAISLAASRGIPYVEGIAMAPNGEAFPHAWNLNPSGRLVDSTWCNRGLVYVGVVFSVERADDATWNGDAYVLGDEHRGYPIFRQRWRGEDFTIVWPHSDRMEAFKRYREGLGYTPPPSVKEWIKQKEASDERRTERAGGLQVS